MACHSGFLLNIFNSALEFDAASVDTMGRWFETGEMRTLSFAVVGNPHPWVRPCAAWRPFRGFRGLTDAGLFFCAGPAARGCANGLRWLVGRRRKLGRGERRGAAWVAGGGWPGAGRAAQAAAVSHSCEAAHN